MWPWGRPSRANICKRPGASRSPKAILIDDHGLAWLPIYHMSISPKWKRSWTLGQTPAAPRFLFVSRRSGRSKPHRVAEGKGTPPICKSGCNVGEWASPVSSQASVTRNRPDWRRSKTSRRLNSCLLIDTATAHLPEPQNPGECHLYFAEGGHLYIAATTSVVRISVMVSRGPPFRIGLLQRKSGGGSMAPACANVLRTV